MADSRQRLGSQGVRNVSGWVSSEISYAGNALRSGLRGATEGRDEFFAERPASPFLRQSVRSSIGSGLLGACIGMLIGYAKERRFSGRVVASSLAGGAVGFGAMFAFQTRELTGKVFSGAAKEMQKAADEHWLEKNPIDYA